MFRKTIIEIKPVEGMLHSNGKYFVEEYLAFSASLQVLHSIIRNKIIIMIIIIVQTEDNRIKNRKQKATTSLFTSMTEKLNMG